MTPFAQRAPGPTALLIEDEDPVRCLIHQILEPARCCVIDTADAETGLRFIERDQPPIDLVVTDLMMPGLDGLDVLNVLHQYRPDLPVLMTSAFAGSIYGVLNRGTHYRILQQPFTAAALQDAMARLLTHIQARSTRAQSVPGGTSEPGTRNAPVCEGNVIVRRPLDLVAAAWAIHREREAERRRREAVAWA